MKEVNLDELTPEQVEKLEVQMRERKAEAAKRLEHDKQAYKEMSEQFVKDYFPKLQNMSESMKGLKKIVFDGAESLIELKAQVYNVKDTQLSHTFTDSLGRSIRMGSRAKDGYDDTLYAGISKVREYVKTLAKDDETGALVDGIFRLLKLDKEGNLKPNRVLELRNMCSDLGNPEMFVEGIDIIEKAYKPSRTCQFIEVSYKDNNGIEKSVSLSMSAL